MTEFYDAADWRAIGELTPAGRLCCLYADGRFAVTAEDIEVLAPADHRMITVTGNGLVASILDGRPDNNLGPAVVRGFVRARRYLEEDAIIYTPRAYVAEYQAALFDGGRGELLAYPRLYWWIATLDGADWTAAGLATDLSVNWDASVPESAIWANQFGQLPALGAAARVDVSRLYQPFRP